MRFSDLFSSFGMFSYYLPEDETFDMDSFMDWIHASDAEREKMELSMTEEGKIAFREKAYELGFFK